MSAAPGSIATWRQPAALELPTIVGTAARFITTEYASLTAAGRPVTWPVTPYGGQTGRTIDVSTGLTYPLKAERARRDRRVALSFSDPTGCGLDHAPTVIVQGLATVRDADLVATSSRYLRECTERFPDLMGSVPTFVMRYMDWYWTRMWVEVTPLRVLWWESGDLDAAPLEWRAPEGTDAPASDPAPAGAPSGSWNQAPVDWRERAEGALDRLGMPVLTLVDATGFPLPVRCTSARLVDDGYVVTLPRGVEPRPGPAFLNFHAHAEVFDGQENIGLAGTADVPVESADGRALVHVRVERALADFGVPRSKVRNMARMATATRRLRPRLRAEAARRNTALPTYADITR